ncbi:pilus assembly protein [Neisseria chenwenguii]|nr:pilus assembly protein [Neisseria chenwenguii]
MSTTSLRKPLKAKPLVYSILAAFSLMGSAGASAAFSNMPFYLDNSKKTNSSENKVKPNVMLFIDDSGSMQQPISKKSPEIRLDVTKTALGRVLDKYTDKINWGLKTLHNNNNSNLLGYTDNWKTVKNSVARITALNGTPTTRRYYELSKEVMAAAKYRCQKNFIVLMSDGDANTSCWREPRWGESRFAKWKTFDYYGDDYFGRKNSGICQYAEGGLYDTVWDRDNGLRFFSQTFATKDFKTEGNDATGKSWNGAPGDPVGSDGKSRYWKQTVDTFTIGFGDSISSSGETYLKNGASKPGYYLAAQAPDELVSAFAKIFDTVESESKNNTPVSPGPAAPALSSTDTPNGAAVVRLDPVSWSSRILFYDINSNGMVKSTFKEPSFTNRKTLININGKAEFTNDASGTNAAFGISGGQPADIYEWKNVLLPWTARIGDDKQLNALAKDKRYSQQYRDRTIDPRTNAQADEDKRSLGDIIGAPITAFGKRVHGRQDFLITAANDGMVHLFRSSAAKEEHPYDLKLSYIPADMERDVGTGGDTVGKTLKELADPEYGKTKPHRYMVNGGFVVRQTAEIEGSKDLQQTFMFGGMGQGGRGAYALNVGGKNRATGNSTGLDAAESTWNTSVPLFETAKGEGNKLGYTVGSPQIGRVSVKRLSDSSKPASLTEGVRYAGFLSSGFRNSKNYADTETALYVYDMLGQEAATGKSVSGSSAGQLIKKITVSDGIGGLAEPTLLDTDFDGVVDLAYAGDYGGNMYRFDLRGESPDKWTVSRIYKGLSTQPITSAPAVSRSATNQYVVIFGTGSELYDDDLVVGQQSVYGIFDDVAVKDVKEDASKTLLEQTFETKNYDGKTYRFLSNKAIDKTQHKGWKINLANDGERVTVKPTMVLRTALLTTHTYKREVTSNVGSADVCIPETTETKSSVTSWLMNIDAETGGAIKSNLDGRVDFMQKNSSLPADIYASALKLNGLINFTFIDPGRKKVDADGNPVIDDNPVTADGDSGGSGTDGALTQSPKIPKNTCFSGGKNISRKIYTNDAQDFDIGGKNCSSVRRISWREIF